MQHEFDCIKREKKEAVGLRPPVEASRGARPPVRRRERGAASRRVDEVFRLHLDEGGGGLHVDEGLLALLSLPAIKSTSTPLSMTYLAQLISSCGMA